MEPDERLTCTFAGPLPIQLLQDVLYREPAERIQVLGKISDAEGSLYRRFFSPAHIRAASTVCVLFCSCTVTIEDQQADLSCAYTRGFAWSGMPLMRCECCRFASG